MRRKARRVTDAVPDGVEAWIDARAGRLPGVFRTLRCCGGRPRHACGPDQPGPVFRSAPAREHEATWTFLARRRCLIGVGWVVGRPGRRGRMCLRQRTRHARLPSRFAAVTPSLASGAGTTSRGCRPAPSRRAACPRPRAGTRASPARCPDAWSRRVALADQVLPRTMHLRLAGGLPRRDGVRGEEGKPQELFDELAVRLELVRRDSPSWRSERSNTRRCRTRSASHRSFAGC